MLVVKRDGKKEPVAFDKITARIKKLCYGFNPEHVDPVVVAQKVVTGVFDGVSTAQLDDLASETAAFLTTQHPDYGKLAARIAVSNMHKQTSKSFSETMYKLHGYINPKTGEHGPLISDELKGIIEDHEVQLNAAIVYDGDFEYDYFGFKTLEKSYLLKLHGKISERPQQMLMRVAVGIHLDDIPRVLETYDLLSNKYFTHATPTLFNAGTPNPQMSSCFLLAMKEDSIDGIYVVTSSVTEPIRPMAAFRFVVAPPPAPPTTLAFRPITHFTATKPGGANILKVWASVWVTWFTFDVPFDMYIKYAFLHTHMRAFGGLWAFANRPEELSLDAPPRALSLPEYLLDVKSREGLADLLSHVQSQPKTDEICRVDEARMPWTADDSVPANLEWDDRRSMLTDKKVPVRCTQRLVAEGTTLTVLVHCGRVRLGSGGRGSHQCSQQLQFSHSRDAK